MNSYDYHQALTKNQISALGLVSLFNGTSTFVGYLMTNPFS